VGSQLVVADLGTVALAVDIGGTKLAAGVVDADGTVLVHRRRPTGGADGEALFATLVELVNEVRRESRVEPAVVGVGCGGPMTRGGATVSPVNIAQWRGFGLRDRLRHELDLPVWVDNDAKALTLAEGWVGAAVGVDNYLGMVVSTGVGGGVVLDGRLLDGADGNAGHIGHVVVEPDGRRCGCGGIGCLEAEASGTAIAAMTGRPAAEADAAMVRRTGTLVGRAVASVANLLDLQMVVVAGSVALGFGAPFFAAAQSEINVRARLEYSRPTTIVPAGLGADAPLIGAAAVAWHRPIA
jgi:glucokinase